MKINGKRVIILARLTSTVVSTDSSVGYLYQFLRRVSFIWKILTGVISSFHLRTIRESAKQMIRQTNSKEPKPGAVRHPKRMWKRREGWPWEDVIDWILLCGRNWCLGDLELFDYGVQNIPRTCDLGHVIADNNGLVFLIRPCLVHLYIET